MSTMSCVRHGSGRPVLLVHGLGSSSRSWEPVVPALAKERTVIAVDLPGFGATPPLAGEVTIATLTDAVESFLVAEGLTDIDIVGSSMGARMVLEMARRGHAGTIVALDPGGFWNTRQRAVFGASIKASIALVRSIQPALPALTNNPVGRTMLLGQFSAHPWRLPADLVLTELRGFKTSPSIYAALDDLVHGGDQQGTPSGSLRARVAIGWGRHDRVTVPSESARALELFPDASLHWFEHCGHFPHWDRPEQTARFILDQIG